MNPIVSVGNFEKIPEKVGLKDGGRIVMECSACGEKLAEVWIVKADAVDPKTGRRLETRGRATCWACGDSSWPVSWAGKWVPGHHGRDVPDPDDPENGPMDSRVTSVIVGFDKDPDGTMVFKTKKAT